MLAETRRIAAALFTLCAVGCGTEGDRSPICTALAGQYEVALPAARACEPGTAPCTEERPGVFRTVDGGGAQLHGCPVRVNPENTSALAEADEILDRYTAAGCLVAALPCPAVVSRPDCGPAGVCQY